MTKQAMTSRERVLCAYNHQAPDRVPICVGGTAQKLSNRTYTALKKHLEINDDFNLDESLDELGNVIHYHPQVLEFLHSDFRHIQINRLPPEEVDGRQRHELGFFLETDPTTGLTNILTHPWADFSAEQIKQAQLPDPADPARTAGLRKTAEQLSEQNEYAIGAYKATLLGIFDLACVLRGMDRFLFDTAADPETAAAILAKTFEFNCGVYSAMLDQIGPFLDVVEFNDDLGTQESLLFSPATYRSLLKPLHKEFVAMLRRKAPQAKIFLHCCGAVRPLIPDLIEIGINILNPIQPLAKGMNPAELKSEFGKDLIFQGGIDLQEAMVGTTEQVEQEVAARVEAFAPGGGYILATANNITSDVPLENVIQLYEAAVRLGKY